MARLHTTRIMGSQSEDEVDSEAVTVRTPNLPPIVTDEEAPFPLVRPPLSAPSTQRLASQQPLSLRAPASKEHESSWFDKESARFVAPGVPEVEPPSVSLAGRRGFVPPSTRGVGFAMVALLLAGVVAAGAFFFLSARSVDEAKVPEPATTTQLTNAELPPPAAVPTQAPAPEVTTPAKPVITTVRTSDLPDVRIDRRKATTPATDPELRPDDSTKNGLENTIPTPSPDSPSTPPDLEEKK